MRTQKLKSARKIISKVTDVVGTSPGMECVMV